MDVNSPPSPCPAVPPSYDPDHALVLCRLHGYRPGLLFLYDRWGGGGRGVNFEPIP